ncbi:transporter substrate-binding protein [Phytohalomonas tamaricis]|uniref:transporter substrate-binding protein n=1 Tax=Phytohalomonas tamaricis TaxID=2081032 RepID=UPI000D0B6DC8|nr:transporter substrate-binding protein [Phytohalomonas tamaricis]
MRREVPIGVLFSTEGTYQRMGQNALAGVQHAIAEINQDAAGGVVLQPHYFNPQGELERYVEGINRFMAAGIRHVFGTITSASRKEIIPDLERADALLWYSCPYEGFECSENVIYLGSSPNQHLVPLLHYALGQFGGEAFLLGSNYVWGWESNRIARELIETAGGCVLGEKYYRFGVTDFSALIETLLASNSAFVLNNLVGESSYHFLRQLDAACVARSRRMPVLSCNFTEGELDEIRAAQHIRLLSCGTFFAALDSAFIARQRMRHGAHPYSHYYASAHAAVTLFAKACQQVGDDPVATRDYLYRTPVATALGELTLSARNNHVALPCYIGEAVGDGFTLVHSEVGMLDADPYLTQFSPDAFHGLTGTTRSCGHLRVIK